jgi:hypothetical protein
MKSLTYIRLGLRSLCILVLFSSASSYAAVIETSFSCPDFILPGTAKTISGAEVRSYNTVTRKVMVKMGRQVKILPLEAMPQEIQQKISAMPLPPPTEAEKLAEQKQDAAFRRARDKNMIQRETQVGQDALNEAKMARDESRRLAVKKAELEMEEQIMLKRQIATMASYARSNFHGSNVIILGAPEEVPGWPGQWRVRGEYDSPIQTNGRTTGYRRKDWSMILKVDSSGMIQQISVEK